SRNRFLRLEVQAESTTTSGRRRQQCPGLEVRCYLVPTARAYDRNMTATLPPTTPSLGYWHHDL
ncbi:hypothetical protein TNCV_4058661, partial [Trichonephila clavipes]